MRFESVQDLKAELLNELLQRDPDNAGLAVGIAPGHNGGGSPRSAWRSWCEDYAASYRPPNFGVRPGAWVTDQTGHIGYTL